MLSQSRPQLLVLGQMKPCSEGMSNVALSPKLRVTRKMEMPPFHSDEIPRCGQALQLQMASRFTVGVRKYASPV